MLVKLPFPEVRFVYTTDWHFSNQPPGRRADDYRAALFAKLEFIRELTEKVHGVGLCGGDVFDQKNPKHPGNTIDLIIQLIHGLRRFPTGRVYGAIGNHDISWDRMASLPHQPLGVLVASRAYYDLNEEPIIFTNEDETVRVQVETFPYADEETTVASILERSKIRPAGIDYRVGIVHAYGQPGNRGNLYDSAIIGYNELKDVEYDFLLWGHDHSRKKTVTVGNVTHVHQGSLARAAFNLDEVDRPVIAAVLAFSKEGIKFQEKTIPVKALDLVFSSSDKGMERVSKSDEVKEFFSSMDEQVGGIESVEPRAVIRALCPDDSNLVEKVYELCGI
jgi:DNA repair exonuclease SbcCD nuclease subunit